jgi:negative regulator of replication initiation
MVTNAKKIDFIQKIKDMQERTKNSKKELLKQIDTKDEDYKIFSSKLKEIQESNHDIFGLMALADIYYLTKKQLAKKELNRLENQNEITTEKEKLINDFFEQVGERINIIEKAESHDLKEFLNNNSLYEIFDDKKFEKYINPQNIAENIKGNEHEFSREKER